MPRRNKAGLAARADQFFTVGGDSSRRLPENRCKIGDWSRLLQPHFEKLIGPETEAEVDAIRRCVVRGQPYGNEV